MSEKIETLNEIEKIENLFGIIYELYVSAFGNVFHFTSDFFFAAAKWVSRFLQNK